MGEIFSLKNQIQNYAWGSREILGRMRGVPVPTEQPEAEVWVCLLYTSDAADE